MNRNRIFVIIAVIGLFALVGVGIYFATQATNNQAPETSFAGVCVDPGRCQPGGNFCGSGYDFHCGGGCNPSNFCDCSCSKKPNPPAPPGNPPGTPPGNGGGGACHGHTCTASQICVAGCINNCRANTKTANGWIDAECQQATCGGNGTVPGAGKSCCAGLNLCSNGRCGVSCGCTTAGGHPGAGANCCGGLNLCGTGSTSICQAQACTPGNTPPQAGNGANGSACTTHSQCQSGFCNATANPSLCQAKIGIGGSCEQGGNTQCQSGRCDSATKKCITTASVLCTATPANSCTGVSSGSGCTRDGNSGTCTPTVGTNCICQTNNEDTTIGQGTCPGTSAGWTLYQCNSCNPSGGCQLNQAGSGKTEAEANAWIAGTGNCSIRQADCQGTSGANLVFKSRINCKASCYSGGATAGTATAGTSTAGSGSGGAGTGGTTTPPAPYCGDAVCATNELCERTSAGASTFKACTTTSGTPTGANVAACYGVQFNQPVSSTTCKWCGDGVFTSGTEQCDSSAPASGGNNPTQCDASCHLQAVANVCVSMTENGVDPIRSGASNFLQYTLIYQNNSTTNPFPNIRLLVSTSNTVATAVGRDANNTASTLVAPIPVGGYSYDAVTSRHTYVFRWESVSTGGVPVPDATYQVRGLTDGTDAGITTTPGACTESLTASAVAVEEPLFNIVKQGAVSCVDNSDATINYTVTVTNVGPVSGVVDFVTDTLDPTVVAIGVTPTNINPSYGSYAGGVITWTGDLSQRTFTAGQSKTYTYSVVIPVGQLLNFAAGVQNLATVQYDTNTTSNNTASFNLRTIMNCTINGIPITGIFDDGRLFLFGLIFIVLGFIAYRYQLGKTISEKLISGAVSTAEEFMPFEDRIERKMEKRMKDKK